MVFFPTKKKFLKCLAMKGVGKFNSQLVYFTVISYILWTFGIFCDHFGIFLPF
jgi:hypothetical protein